MKGLTKSFSLKSDFETNKNYKGVILGYIVAMVYKTQFIKRILSKI